MSFLFIRLTIKWKSWGQSLLHLFKIVLTNSNVRFNVYFHDYYAIKLMVCNEVLSYVLCA
jgi:hypothetical protein